MFQGFLFNFCYYYLLIAFSEFFIAKSKVQIKGEAFGSSAVNECQAGVVHPQNGLLIGGVKRCFFCQKYQGIFVKLFSRKLLLTNTRFDGATLVVFEFYFRENQVRL
jgi:hypothetical protein